MQQEASYPLLQDRYSYVQKIARKVIYARLAQLQRGKLTIVEGGERYQFGSEDAPAGEIVVSHPSFFQAVISGGSVGAAESYMRGEWDSPDLTSLMQVMSRNMQVTNAMETGLAAVMAPFLKMLHWTNKNTREGSRRNISQHYDLSNDFFAQFLDPTMMYSCAVWPHDQASLQAASEHKLERVCQKLALKPSDHLLEIGTGWGSMAIWAAKHYGCKVTTTTISKEQHRYAEERIKAEGLEDKITLLLDDYRDLEGTYDKLVSIEMIEAVGHHFLGTYLAKCSSLLKEDGMMLIQAITMPDNRYEQALREVDFIKRYIFPGSFIPSISAILNEAGKNTDLILSHLEDQGSHYARTLDCWAESFRQQQTQGEIAQKPEWFRRMWNYYFAYCSGGFRERVIGCAQMLFSKQGNRQKPLLHPFDSVKQAGGKPC